MRKLWNKLTKNTKILIITGAIFYILLVLTYITVAKNLIGHGVFFGISAFIFLIINLCYTE